MERHRTLMIVGSVVAAGLTAGIAYAIIPDATGLFHGCYDNRGSLRVVDSESDCRNNETPIQWHQGRELRSTQTFVNALLPAGGTEVTVSAACPPGWIVTGGGYSMGGFPDPISKVHVRTANAGLPTFYNVSATNFDASSDVTLNIAANCIQLR